jgi:dTDP-4-amino-4,6-dideoxygalactose transaminase
LYPATRLGEWTLPQLREWIIPAKDDPDYRFVNRSRAPFKPFMKQMQTLQLARLVENIARRRDIIQQIKTGLSHIAEIRFLDEDKHGRSNGSYFGLYVPDPAALTRHLARHGIGSNPQEYYDCAALAQFSAYRPPCLHAGYASDHLLRLPSYPWLRPAEIEHIGTTIGAFFGHG